MRRREKQITDKNQLSQILKTARVCRLAMVDKDMPYVVPLNFGYRDGVVYFHGAKQGRKINILKKNPNVCFEIDELIKLEKAKSACDWGAKFHSIIATGKVQFLEKKEDKIKGLDIIMAQYSGRRFVYSEKMLDKTVVGAIQLDRICGKKS